MKPPSVRWPTDPAIASTQLAGSLLGGYQVLGRIGHGGMGAVYLARRPSLGGIDRLYALKVMHEHLCSDPRAVAMLFDEARAATCLHHPNVVGVEALEVDAGRYFLVMPYVEGCTFAQLLKRTPDFREPGRVAAIMLDALDGLHAAHVAHDYQGKALGIIHRDFSPDNLLVGLDGVVRVADFGIAKTAIARTHTAPGAHKGKFAYMSPEQLKAQPLDRRADLFAAGVVLYTALTGETLFLGDSEPETMRRILEMPIIPPSRVGLEPPASFDRVVLKALERDRERRYQSAAEMAVDLRSAVCEAGVVPSRTAVAGWVQVAFGRQLAARWQVIRSLIAGLSAADPPLPMWANVPPEWPESSVADDTESFTPISDTGLS